MMEIMRWVDSQYKEEGRTTAISDQEMIDLVKKWLPEEYRKSGKK